MVSLERLSVAAVNETSLEALEHRHRYQAVRRFCEGKRVLDLCCGVGYGAAILAEVASSVIGVDRSPEALAEAKLAYGHVEGLELVAADAVAWLDDPARMAGIDVVVCFEGVEHVPAEEQLLEALVRTSANGTTVIFSVPNSRRYEEDNRFHVHGFDRDALQRWVERFAAPAVVWEQWHAQGSLIAPEADPARADGTPLMAPIPSGAQPRGWAGHYLVLVHAEAAEQAPAEAELRWTVEPVNARWLESLKRANRELWAANERLADTKDRPRGTYGAAAASVAARWEQQALAAEERAGQAEAALAARIADEQQIAARYEEIKSRRAVRIALGTANRISALRRLGRG